MEGIKIFQKKNKTKSENMIVNNTEIFLRKAKSVTMTVNNTEIYQKMKNRGYLSAKTSLFWNEEVNKDYLIFLLMITHHFIKEKKINFCYLNKIFYFMNCFLRHKSIYFFINLAQFTL